MKTTQRDEYLDFYRGIAAISVVFIHTVFYSGAAYVPEIFRTLSLLLDVPLFVFLSGWAASYNSSAIKTFDNIIKIGLQYYIFMFVVDVVYFGIFRWEGFSPSVVVEQLAFSSGYTIPKFPVVTGSLWFLPMWIPVSLVGGILVPVLRRYDSDHKIVRRILLFFFIGVVGFSTNMISEYFIFSRNFCFYFLLFLLGYCSVDFRFSGKWSHYILTCVSLVGIWWLISRLFQISARNLQNAKFPPHIMYLAASLLSIVTAVCLRNRIDPVVKKMKFIQFIGKNALCFYFAQGIGSSLLYHVYPVFLPLGWLLTLAVCFVVNLAITLALGTVMAYFYTFLFGLLQKIKALEQGC